MKSPDHRQASPPGRGWNCLVGHTTADLRTRASVDFTSAYAHGFARVAACTVPVAIADPATNAATILAEARACHDEGVAVALFPELGPERLRHRRPGAPGHAARRGREAVETVVEASARPAARARRRRAAACTATASTTAPWSIHRGGSSASRPKSYLPTYREFYERRHFGPGDDQRGGDASR